MPPPASIAPSLPPHPGAVSTASTAPPPPSSTAGSPGPSLDGEGGGGSNLRKKRPPGATDLSLVNRGGASGGAGGALGSALANALSSGGCLSGASFMGVLETPQELKQFASQLSPHLGIKPDAMLDFLATDDVINEIANGLTNSPLRSARQELGAEQRQRLEAAADAAPAPAPAAAVDEAMAAFENA